jgi:beta-barrel assembly-enhancing protease
MPYSNDKRRYMHIYQKLSATLLIMAHMSMYGQAAVAAINPISANKAQLDLRSSDITGPSSSLENRATDDNSREMHLPEIGDPSGTVMSSQQEIELGAAFFRSLHSQLHISEDTEITDYIQRIGQKLSANSADPEHAYHFFVVMEPNINAFAGPGGYIGVNSGLILTTEAESELASVLAHEIAHVTQRHLYQAYQAAGRLSLPTAVAMLAGILIGAKSGNAQASQAAIIAAQAANQQYQINFTRDNEAEADRVGMQTLSKSEFDPRSMPVFFERMQQSTRFAGNAALPEFLLTHPVTVSRISDTRGRAEKYNYRQYQDSFIYQIIRAKLRVLSATDLFDVEKYFRAISDQGTQRQQDVTHYGLALSLQGQRKYEEARPLLQKLVIQHPDQSHFVNALAKIEIDDQHYPAALKHYAMALERFPANRGIAFNYARLLLLMKKPLEARNLLDTYQSTLAPSSEFYELLGECYGELHNEAESHRYIAESYYLNGQTHTAISQMKLARQHAGNNFYINAVIDERLQAWLKEEAESREQ